MVNQIELRGYSSSVMINSTFRVVHTHFEVDVDMMMIYVSGENGTKWLLDGMDYGGVRNLKLDGVSVSDKETEEYFDFLKKLKVDYEDQVIRSVEELIENFTDKDVDEMIYRTMGSEKLPTPKGEVTFEDVEKVCTTIDVVITNEEKVDIIDKSNHYLSKHPNSVDSKLLVIENFIYNYEFTKQRI